jgi:hypothetical protein
MVHSYRRNGGMRFSIRPLQVKRFQGSGHSGPQAVVSRSALLLSRIGKGPGDVTVTFGQRLLP